MQYEKTYICVLSHMRHYFICIITVYSRRCARDYTTQHACKTNTIAHLYTVWHKMHTHTHTHTQLGIFMRIFASRYCTDCTRVICGCRWGVHAMCYVGCRLRRGCLVFVASKPRWPHCAIVPGLHLHRQRTLSSAHLSDCVLHIWPISMVCTCNDIPHDIPECDPPCTYIRTWWE